MAGLILQDKDRLERTPSSLKQLGKDRKVIGQDYTPEHPTCEVHAGLGGALAEAAEQFALLAIAAGLEQHCPHTHAVLPGEHRLLGTTNPGLSTKAPHTAIAAPRPRRKEAPLGG